MQNKSKMTNDLLITGGQVFDGTGSPGRMADVAILDGKIVAIGSMRDEKAKRMIDARGLVVCPGFIDIHAHGEEQLLITPLAEAKLMQGITTMVGGNCGISAAPIQGPLTHFVNQSGVFTGVDVDWSTFAEFFQRLETNGIAINLACLVGNATVRASVLGMEARKPTQLEMEEMKRLVAEAMQQGGFGLSSGLVYTPGSFADTEEIIELAREAAKKHGFYASHVRGMARPIFQAVMEAINIGEETGIPVQISHLNPGYPSWGIVAELVEFLEAARDRGLNITADTLLYDQSIFSGGGLLPNWANEGGLPALLRRLEDPMIRQQIKDDTRLHGDQNGGGVGGCLIQDGKWNQIWFTRPERVSMKDMAELAQSVGAQDPFDAYLDLLLEEKGNVSGISRPYSQRDVDYTVSHPLIMPGTDDRPVSRSGSVLPWHTRGYGSFARLMGWYVRERKLLSLEQAIRKSTSLPAWRLGLTDRGSLKEGYCADVTLFNPDSIQETGNTQDPAQYPQGIHSVIVNGKVVVDQGEHTGELSGRVLRHAQGK